MLTPPWLFAHRGARAHAPENTVDSFQLALRLGASGIESDVWRTRDDVLVLHHDGLVGGRLRRRSIAELSYEELPTHIPRLSTLLDLAATHSAALSLDLKDVDAADLLAATLAERPAELLSRTYVCVEEFAALQTVVERHPHLALIDSSRLARIDEGPERRLARLADLGVRGLNMHHSDWNGGLVVLAHRFERLAFAWDAQFDYAISSLLRMGIDGVYSDWPDRLVDVARNERIL